MTCCLFARFIIDVTWPPHVKLLPPLRRRCRRCSAEQAVPGSLLQQLSTDWNLTLEFLTWLYYLIRLAGTRRRRSSTRERLTQSQKKWTERKKEKNKPTTTWTVHAHRLTAVCIKSSLTSSSISNSPRLLLLRERRAVKDFKESWIIVVNERIVPVL